MGQRTSISWCDHTWNPWRGCTKISPGCTNCYAETLSHRNPKVLGVWGDKAMRSIAVESYWHQPFLWDKKARLAGERRRDVIKLLTEQPAISNRRVTYIAGVSRELVNAIRNNMIRMSKIESCHALRWIGKDGKTYWVSPRANQRPS